MRETGQTENDLVDRLAEDARLGLGRSEIDALLADRGSFVGLAGAQVEAVLRRITEVTQAAPEAAGYRPQPIL